MRPRFSLRWMLIAFALMAFALYLFVVRPTTLAQRFVAAVLQQDYEGAQKLMTDPEAWGKIVQPKYASKADRIYAEVMPREWQDVWRGQRQIILRISRHVERNGDYTDWTEDTDIVAGPRGLSETGDSRGSATFHWPTTATETEPAIINPGEGVRLEPNSPRG